MKGAVASGHPLTCQAACEVLKRGGNAFDAVVAAAFASTVTEPTLTSLAGGGFLLFHDQQRGEAKLIDFFVNTPGIGCDKMSVPNLIPANVRFRSTEQIFHIGIGSVAVPGTLMGLVHCFKTLCTLDIEDIIAPALRFLDKGVEVSPLMSYLLKILRPILTYSDYGKEIYSVSEGDRIFNPLLRKFLGTRSPDAWIDSFYRSDPFPIEGERIKGNCLLTDEDFRGYRVIEREPLDIGYRSYHMLTNPPPSFGGLLLCLSLSLLEHTNLSALPPDEREMLLAQLMETIRDLRKGIPATGMADLPFDQEKLRSCRLEMEKLSKCTNGISRNGTTHISVIDDEGNAASMTASNGSNSGCFFGETGIMLNNMMGEDDLHPDGFYSLPPGKRVSSMMSPSFIKRDGDIFAVLGSGGSKRIRTAILQAVVNLIDLRLDVSSAIEKSRIHFDDKSILQVEPGFDPDVIEKLAGHYNLNLWTEKDMYFGGVHTVLQNLSGHGDSRRGGFFMQV